jgi:hypothetical protein
MPVVEMRKEGRKNLALKLEGLVAIKASGPRTPRQWIHRQ